MPCYDYKCKICDNVFTITKSMTDDSIPHCPGCSAKEVERVWGSINLGGKTKGGGAGSSGCNSCSGGSCSTCK